MQKQNGFKMFERDFRVKGMLNGKDYAELFTQFNITKVDSDRYFSYLRKNNLSIIPSESEQEKKEERNNKFQRFEKPKAKKAA